MAEEKLSWKDTNLALSKLFVAVSSTSIIFGEESFSQKRLSLVCLQFCLWTSCCIHSTITVGSDIDHKVKEAAAQGEEAWEGMGETPELRVWRIEKFTVKPWPKEQYGEFFKGDSYIGKSCLLLL